MPSADGQCRPKTLGLGESRCGKGYPPTPPQHAGQEVLRSLEKTLDDISRLEKTRRRQAQAEVQRFAEARGRDGSDADVSDERCSVSSFDANANMPEELLPERER